MDDINSSWTSNIAPRIWSLIPSRNDIRDDVLRGSTFSWLPCGRAAIPQCNHLDLSPKAPEDRLKSNAFREASRRGLSQLALCVRHIPTPGIIYPFSTLTLNFPSRLFPPPHPHRIYGLYSFCWHSRHLGEFTVCIIPPRLRPCMCVVGRPGQGFMHIDDVFCTILNYQYTPTLSRRWIYYTYYTKVVAHKDGPMRRSG